MTTGELWANKVIRPRSFFEMKQLKLQDKWGASAQTRIGSLKNSNKMIVNISTLESITQWIQRIGFQNDVVISKNIYRLHWKIDEVCGQLIGVEHMKLDENNVFCVVTWHIKNTLLVFDIGTHPH